MKNVLAALLLFFLSLPQLSAQTLTGIDSTKNTPHPSALPVMEQYRMAQPQFRIGRALEFSGGLIMALSPFMIIRPTESQLAYDPDLRNDYHLFNITMAVGASIALIGIADELYQWQRTTRRMDKPRYNAHATSQLRFGVQRHGLGFAVRF